MGTTTATTTATITPTERTLPPDEQKGRSCDRPFSFQAFFFFLPATSSTPSNAPYPTLTSGLQAMPQVLPRLIDHMEYR